MLFAITSLSTAAEASVQKAIDDSIWTWPAEQPQLRGSRCQACAATVFPAQEHCPACSVGAMTELLLPRSGTLIAWTVQGFAPGAPYAGPKGHDFTPFGVGLVQLGDVVRVEGRLTENDPAALRFGMDVELTVIPFATDTEGNETMTFAFRPTQEPS
jgi:uncharacterized OB-fold protein